MPQRTSCEHINLPPLSSLRSPLHQTPATIPSSTSNRPTYADIANPSHRNRKHDTEVYEAFKPAVTKETVIPVETVQETVALDREVHQDHHQTRIHPVVDNVREEEKHEHTILPVEYRETHHGKDAEIKRKLDAEVALPPPSLKHPPLTTHQDHQFTSTTTVLPISRNKLSAGTMSGEHVHHHVHEKVQPVIEREIVQPTVIHTTIPIHERIEHEPTFYPATVQPRMTMEEFRRVGGTLNGRIEVCDVFEGEPQVKENGGAGQTHPNAYGRERTGGISGGAFRQGGTTMRAGGEERLREGSGLREDTGMKTPPVEA